MPCSWGGGGQRKCFDCCFVVVFLQSEEKEKREKDVQSTDAYSFFTPNISVFLFDSTIAARSKASLVHTNHSSPLFPSCIVLHSPNNKQLPSARRIVHGATFGLQNPGGICKSARGRLFKRGACAHRLGPLRAAVRQQNHGPRNTGGALVS